MQGIKRKIVFVTAYEVIGWLISALALAFLSGNSAETTGPLALVITTIAVSWNFIFNTAFEYWESKQNHVLERLGVGLYTPYYFN